MSRPRGFAAWRPQAKSRILLDAVKSILEEYREYLPLTIRQIFYRLVGKNLLDKEEKAYANLCEMLNRARRAGEIGMDAIRDDGLSGDESDFVGYLSMEFFDLNVALMAKNYQHDRQEGQARHLILWCEAAGMVPQLERAAKEYGVPVKSSGGFDSTTIKHMAGKEFADCTILHVGDFDPSGECMYDAFSEDVKAFASHYGGTLETVRLAVTSEQVKAFKLETAPPKASSHQQRKQMLETVQAEALAPSDLAAIVRSDIESRFDLHQWRQVLAMEAEELKIMMERYPVPERYL